VRKLLSAAFLLLCLSFAAFAQKSTGEIKGTVLDPGNAAVPKAAISARDLSTGITRTTNSGSDGAYLIPNLLGGTYDVTVTAPGFQTTVATGVIVEAGRTIDLVLNLKVGQITETVEVSGSAAMLETTSNQVAATIRNDYVKELPLSGRDTLSFAALSAGATQTAGTSTNPGVTTFNGLFEAALNISLDGINVNDTRNKSGQGFSSLVPLRLDAVDEVTVSTSGLESDAAAQGAVTVRFTTRRGTNQFHGSLFSQIRNDALNAGEFFNNMRSIPKSKVRANDFGGNLGGPLRLPFAPFLRNKLFFFVNYEDAPRPGSANSTATVLTDEAQKGIFRYVGTDNAQHTVDLLAFAGAAGYQRTIDPTVQAALTAINGTLGRGSLLPSSSNLYQNSLTWKQTTGSRDIYPTVRLDYQITNNIAWHGSWNLQHQHINPTGVPYPGLGIQSGESKFTRYSLSNGLDWTVTPTLFNSFKLGVQSSVSGSNIGNSVHQWGSQGDKRVSFGSGIGAFIPNATPLIRTNPAYTISDQFNWLKGKHNFKFGGSLIYTRFYENDFYQFSGVLNYSLGGSTNDPINSLFTAANIPFIRAQDVPTALQLYATLTGRVSNVQGYENIDEKARQYAKFAPLVYRENYRSQGLYFQDSWRITPRLTMNYGLRWEFTGVMTNTNNTFMSPSIEDILAPSRANFQPGVFADINHVPSINQRSVTYAPDRLNPAPNIGLAWNPRADGFLGKLLGGNRTVIRASYGISYFDEGLNVDYWVNTNAGNWRSVSAAPGTEYTPGSLTLQSPDPKFLVAPPSFNPPFAERQFAFQNYNVGTTAGKSNGPGNLPTLRNPYVQSWNFSIQRELARDTVLEVRYVGNKTTHKWHLYGVQEDNIYENGFLKEFINAQNNLKINQAAGVNSFQNRGLAGQVALPIYEAAFAARGTCSNCGAITTNFTSNTFINQLTQGNAGSAAFTLQGATSANSIYYCRLVGSNFGPCLDRGFDAAGPYPINFFVPNPYVGDLTITDDNSWSTYNGLQVDLRRRLQSGLTITANYTWSHGFSDLFAVNNTLTQYYSTIRNFAMDKAPTPFDVRHSFQAYGTYDLPFGKGRRFEIHNGLLNRLAGGWSLSGIWRIATGHPAKLTSGQRTVNNNSGTDVGVILAGMSLSQLQQSLRSFSDGPRGTTLYSADRGLVGADGRANPQYLSLPTTPGQFGQFLYVAGPSFFSADMAVSKEVPIRERARFVVQAEFLNFMNHPVFAPGSYSISNTSFGQTSSVQVGARNVQLRGYLRW
jgi:hypothetical protein